MPIEPTDLPYAHDALEPHISAETLRLHHGKHYAGSVQRASAMSDGGPLDGASLERLVVAAEGELLDHAAQAWNHQFYFEGLAPESDAPHPAGELRAALLASFGDLDLFREAFSERARGHLGSGWVWLVLTPHATLEIVETHDAECPLRAGHLPLLVIDVWEHAYYLDHQQDRGAYVEAFWKVVDWDVVARRHRAATEALTARRQPRVHGGAPPGSLSTLVPSSVLGALLLAVLVILPGCDELDASDAGHEIDDVIEDVEDVAEDVVDETEDHIEDAADAVEDSVDGH